MTQEQQELYEKLLKKVNEYCLGYAAEDVIAAIDALVENYEKPKKRITKTKDQLLVENECYQFMLHQVRYYVESKEYSLEDIIKRLKALEIIYTKEVDMNWLALQFEGADLKDLIEYVKEFPLLCSDKPLTEKEIVLIKETYDETTN